MGKYCRVRLSLKKIARKRPAKSQLRDALILSSDPRDGNMFVTGSAHVYMPLLHSNGVRSGGDDGVGVIPIWWKQITLRGFVVSVFLGACVTSHKLYLIVGVVPSLNVAAGLLGFFFVTAWTQLLSRFGVLGTPFTRQENTVIQTCVVACYGIAISGGFGSYLFAMDETSYNLVGSSYTGNRAQDVKNPSLGWIVAFLLSVSFLGIFSVVPLQKVLFRLQSYLHWSRNDLSAYYEELFCHGEYCGLSLDPRLGTGMKKA